MSHKFNLFLISSHWYIWLMKCNYNTSCQESCWIWKLHALEEVEFFCVVSGAWWYWAWRVQNSLNKCACSMEVCLIKKEKILVTKGNIGFMDHSPFFSIKTNFLGTLLTMSSLLMTSSSVPFYFPLPLS